MLSPLSSLPGAASPRTPSIDNGTSRAGQHRPRRLVPGDGPLQALLKRSASDEAEQLMGTGRVKCPSGLAVRFGGIPADLAAKAAHCTDQMGEVADRDLAAGTEVDGQGTVVSLGTEDDPLGGVLDVDELPRRRAGAPNFDGGVAAVAGIDALLDQ